MNIKKYFRRSIHYLLKGVPEQHITAQISYLSPNGLLKERTALITGGTSGIGFAIAKCFLQAGAKVIITGRTEDKLKEKCLELEKFESCRGCVSGFVWDVMDISHFEACLNRCLEKVGKIDILVNNAGTLGGEFGHTTETEYDTVLDTNLKGAFFLSQCIGKYMKEMGFEAIS